MIEVENLTKDYGSHRGIKDLTFSAAKGDVIGFLGPNGAGKTTTMRILTCFFPATSGRAVVAGFDCFEDSLEVRKRLGYLPENVPLYKDMRVSDYLSFVAGIKGVEARELNDRVTGTMGDCGLENVSGRLIGELSKGYRQRVGLAQALVNNPEILILDEPTNGLDPKQIREIRNLITELAAQRTVILCTHILPEVSMVCKKVVIINEGKLVAVDTPENLTNRLSESARIFIQVSGDPNDVEKALRKVDGVENVTREESHNDGGFIIDLAKGANANKNIPPVIIANDWDLIEMRTMDASLEDVFIKLVTTEEGASA